MRRGQAAAAQHTDLFNGRESMPRSSFPSTHIQFGGVTAATVGPVVGCSGSPPQPAGEKNNRANEVPQARVAQNTTSRNAAPTAAAAQAPAAPAAPAPATPTATPAERQEKTCSNPGIDDCSTRIRPDRIPTRKLPRNNGDMESKLARAQRGKASRMRDMSADGLRNDRKSCSTISTTSEPARDVASTTATSQASDARRYSTCNARSSPHRPRRDSFGASLQAAISTSSLSIPRPLVFQGHAEEGSSQSSHTSRFAKESVTDEQVVRQKLREGTRLEHKGTREALGTKLPQRLKPPSRLEVDHAAPGSDWMNDEEWLQVCRHGYRSCVGSHRIETIFFFG